MAASRTDRLRAGAGSISEWLTDRTDDIADKISDFYRGADEVPPKPNDLAGKVAAAGREAGRAKLRDAVGVTGLAAGAVVGAGDGAVEMARGLPGAARFTLRLLNPVDSFISPRGEAAWDQVVDTSAGLAAKALDAEEYVAKDPRGAFATGVQWARDKRREIDPNATPVAPTLKGEFLRNLNVGRNDGRLIAELAPYALGVGELEAAAPLTAVARAARVDKYIQQGFSAEKAEYLAQPYGGMGHHSVIPRRARLPDFLGGGPVPQAILDSPFNVVKPANMTRGDFYELHYGVDPYFKGTRLSGPPRRGGGWSGKRLGLQRYNAPQRLWYGTPNATRQAVAVAGILGPFGSGED